jgi:hypothetical protein
LLQEREKAEVVLKQMEGKGKGPFKVKFYPGTFHGFAIRSVHERYINRTWAAHRQYMGFTASPHAQYMAVHGFYPGTLHGFAIRSVHRQYIRAAHGQYMRATHECTMILPVGFFR